MLKPSLPALLLPPAQHLPCGVQTLGVLQHQGSHPEGELPLRTPSPKCPLQPFQILFTAHCAPTFIDDFSPSAKLHNPCLQQAAPLDPTQPRGAHSRNSLFMGRFRPCPSILTFSQEGIGCVDTLLAKVQKVESDWSSTLREEAYLALVLALLCSLRTILKALSQYLQVSSVEASALIAVFLILCL